MKYDYLIVGSGLFGSVFAHEMGKKNKKCLVIEKRNHLGGNVYTYNESGINIHKYGAHILYTNSSIVWDYLNQFTSFNRFTNNVIARYYGEQFNMPFNMHTFHQMWGVKTPAEAQKIIAGQTIKHQKDNPENLEEHVLSMVGDDLYEKLVKGYSEKQWGRPCTALPPSVISRIPLRFTYDNNYYNTLYQGIPIGGYTKIIEKMLSQCDVALNEDFLDNRNKWHNQAVKILYTGMIDEYFEYCHGTLEYRGLFFDTKIMETDNFQGVAVVNYTDKDIPYTRTIEHKHFEFAQSEVTAVSYEYPQDWKQGEEAFYPINDARNIDLYNKYFQLANKNNQIIFGGRLGNYKYTNMQDTVLDALALAKLFT